MRTDYEVEQVRLSMELEYNEGMLSPELVGFYKALLWVLEMEEDE